MKKIPVLMDCDPGHDDAMAIILALSSEKLNVLGITSACGNQTIEKTTKNARSVCEFLGRRDIPIAQGRKAPLLTPIEQNRCAMACQGCGAVLFLLKKQWNYFP